VGIYRQKTIACKIVNNPTPSITLIKIRNSSFTRINIKKKGEKNEKE